MTSPRLEERSPLLLGVLLLYFFAGAVMVLSGAIQIFRAVPVSRLAVDLGFSALLCALAFAAWRRRRWGYFGLVLLGAWVVFLRTKDAWRLRWSDTQADLYLVFAVAMLGALLVHHRQYLPPARAGR